MTLLESGLYDKLISQALAERLEDPGLIVEAEKLGTDAASLVLGRHVFDEVTRALASIKGAPQHRLASQIALVNQLIDQLVDMNLGTTPSDRVTSDVLREVRREADVRLGSGALSRPSIPLRHSDLIVNGPRDLRVGREIMLELASADRVDILVSFVMWTGFVELRDALQAFCDRFEGNPPLRILTTTYMGATDVEALEALVKMGAEVRVSYDPRRTRLHAKAWFFHRASGFSTALIGSSNLSYSALRDGCEWNVRLSSVDNPAVLNKFQVTFQQYWAQGVFEPYDRERFVRVVKAPRDRERDALAVAIRLHPYPHQQQVLEALKAERAVGHNRNLVIAATGTGKTVMAALDYKHEASQRGGRPSLLFVAHRREIIEKARATYRAALGDGAFGELLTGRDKPIVGRHVFANIQSLHEGRLNKLAPDAYDVVVVDEFHHAEAKTYTALLDRLKPKILLGLTATPERTDNRSILHWFGGRIAAESRLWDALDQGLLVPFQYFGVHDDTDLSQIDFRGGRYSVEALERVYTADEHRALNVLRSLQRRVRDPHEMRALCFCVSVKHAQFMAEFFNQKGLPAQSVTGGTGAGERREAVRQLSRGEICAIFVVDVFNEGVDIPAVDTVLFLRPTESATLFLQQLGRGLRLHEGKGCLTVLDFIGRPNRRFRFDRRFRAMLGGGTRAQVRAAVELRFPRLPSGCSIQLEERAQAAVLNNIKRNLDRWHDLAEDLQEDWPLATFLASADISLEELYRPGKSFSLLRTYKRYLKSAPQNSIIRAFPRLLHIDDRERLSRWRHWLHGVRAPEVDQADPYQLMLFAVLGQAQRPVSELGDFFDEIWSQPALIDELRQLMDILEDRCRKVTTALPLTHFQVHGTYSRDEISACLKEIRKGKLLRTQSGVLKCEQHRCDILYVTLEKDEKDFSPTTLYNDYPMSQHRFHWESQSMTRWDSDTGRRYRKPPLGWRVLLFVRKTKKDSRGVTMPYLLLGPVTCASARDERPIKIEWTLETPMPAGWFQQVKIAAG